MSKHTPGPWDVIDQYVIAADESVICQWESYTDKADAGLIAAAPDLLAALKATLAHVDDDMNGRRVTLWKLRETVCAAIAKAEGVA